MQKQAIHEGWCKDPHAYLGRHAEGKRVYFRAYLPQAEKAWLTPKIPMVRLEGTDVFEANITPTAAKKIPDHYEVSWQEFHSEEVHSVISPYSFWPQIGELDIHYFLEGNHHHAYRFLGAHVHEVDGIKGVRFAVWAPNAQRVSVVGSFNHWHGLRHPMRILGSTGIWELFIPHLMVGDWYEYEIRSQQGHILRKTDPYAQAMAMRPATNSQVYQTQYQWNDQAWLKNRAQWNWQKTPMSVYEVHLGSWQTNSSGGFLSYRELAEKLVEYVVWMGFTHIELLPIMEHPLDESWGYQVSGFYSATSRFGTPDDLRYLIDKCHQANIGVLLDWVPGHFPKDNFALSRFDGTALYEHEDPRQGEHKDWGTHIFNYGRNEVKAFLISNANFWLEEFHFDGLRVDAVASMLYLDYSRNEGEWIPNQYGGRENLEAIAFLQQLNAVIHKNSPGAITIAEESTSWPMVTKPTYMGGLGFSMKWNMGWMNDTLSYMELEPIYRRYHHNKLTFSQIYAYSENFVLPLSHDEVVHLKKALAAKMPGDSWQQQANLRLLYAYQWLHPGKKLLFMGSEFGQWHEWNAKSQLEWGLTHHPAHRGIMQWVRDLNQTYCQSPALHERDFDGQGFQWIDCNDSDQSVISFIRWSENQHYIVILNFTPVVRHHYRLGVPCAGQYVEHLNSDWSQYGGSNQTNAGVIPVEDYAWMHQQYSISITLPPLGALVLKPN